MQKIEYKTLDKTNWGDGPWQNEPDKVQWLDENTGLPCMIRRGPSGAWCGYVGVASTHPAFEKDYDDVEVEVHCGLTFAGACELKANVETGICHIVEPNEDDNVWWLGFDCAHGVDYMPAFRAEILDVRQKMGDFNALNKLCSIFEDPLDFGESYRDIEYVTKEVLGLAEQLKIMAAN